MNQQFWQDKSSKGRCGNWEEVIIWNVFPLFLYITDLWNLVSKIGKFYCLHTDSEQVLKVLVVDLWKSPSRHANTGRTFVQLPRVSKNGQERGRGSGLRKKKKSSRISSSSRSERKVEVKHLQHDSSSPNQRLKTKGTSPRSQRRIRCENKFCTFKYKKNFSRGI